MISVVIPVYNSAPYLRQCLDSVLAQTFKDWELLLVDDASADGSSDICREYAAHCSRVRVLRHDTNRGVSAARNTGIHAACGEWITFVDADDTLSPSALTRLHEVAVLTDAPIVCGAITRSPKWKPGHGYSMHRAAELIAATLHQLPGTDNCPVGKIYRRSIFGHGLLFEEGMRFEDLDLFYRLYQRAGSVAVIPDTVYYYRQHPHSFMNTPSVSTLDIVTVCERLLAWAADSGDARIIRAAADRAFAGACTALSALRRLPDNPQVRARALNLLRDNRRAALQSPRLKNRIAAIVAPLLFKKN